MKAYRKFWRQACSIWRYYLSILLNSTVQRPIHNSPSYDEINVYSSRDLQLYVSYWEPWHSIFYVYLCLLAKPLGETELFHSIQILSFTYVPGEEEKFNKKGIDTEEKQTWSTLWRSPQQACDTSRSLWLMIISQCVEVISQFVDVFSSSKRGYLSQCLRNFFRVIML